MASDVKACSVPVEDFRLRFSASSGTLDRCLSTSPHHHPYRTRRRRSHAVAIPRRILIVRTAGDIVWDESTPPGDFDWRRTTALPRALGGKFEREPLHVDLTWATTPDAMSPRNARFRGDALRIAARLHGRSPDDMEGEDIRVHRRNIVSAWTAGALVTAAAVTAGYQAVVARRAALDSCCRAASRNSAAAAVRVARSAPLPIWRKARCRSSAAQAARSRRPVRARTRCSTA